MEEKGVLLKEIHHRIRNNLNIVSSLLEFQARSVDDEQVRAMFQDSQNRIFAMASIHEHLYQPASFTHVEIKPYIQNLVSDLGHIYSEQDITMQVNVEDVKLESATAIPLGLIISEITSNSLKHAFHSEENWSNGTKTKKINIVLKQNGDWFRLIINDNGIGLPSKITPSNSTTLGLQLISMLARQLEGSLDLGRPEGVGTETSLSFPVPMANRNL